jgi:nucleoside-diphosphate-sugar epimerase
MRVFVTGGTGFLGRRVVQRLAAQGHQVRVLARNPDKAAPVKALGAEIVLGDLGNIDGFKSALAGCDCVVLVGARAVSSGKWEEFVQENVVATERMIDESLAAGARRVVYVSSLGIFDIPRDGVTITEDTDYDHEPLLRGNYTRSKIDADRVAMAAARSGKPVVVVRPGRIYGHDHPLNQPLYLGRVKKKLPGGFCVVIGKGSYLTPISYVENAADAVVAAATAPNVDGRAFNVVDDPDLTHKTYFRAVSRLPGFPRRYVFLPVGLFVTALVLVDFLHRLVRRRAFSVGYQLRRSGRSARYSTDAAHARLGWQPRVALEDALRETAVPHP